MPIKLKNANVLPRTDVDTVSVLELNIPITGELPFGAQVEFMDLQAAYAEGKFGHYEYMLRLFCLFTRRLPKREWVSYEWLAQQHLEQDEITELMAGLSDLLTAYLPKEGAEGNAPKRAKKK